MLGSTSSEESVSDDLERDAFSWFIAASSLLRNEDRAGSSLAEDSDDDDDEVLDDGCAAGEAASAEVVTSARPEGDSAIACDAVGSNGGVEGGAAGG